MGCVSSKLIKKEIEQENLHNNHVVSLTSSTYGVLNINKEKNKKQQQEVESKNPEEVELKNPEVESKNPEVELKNPQVESKNPEVELKNPQVELKNPEVESKNPQVELKNPQVESKNQQVVEVKKQEVVEVKKQRKSDCEPSEIINTWELMEGLEEQGPVSVQSKKSPKSRLFLRNFADLDHKSPLKFLNQMGSPRKAKTFGGKENKRRVKGGTGTGSLENSPKTVLKECNNLKENVKKPSPRLWASIKGSPNVKRCDSLRIDSGVVLSRRRSLGPIFDPLLVASLEKEVSEEEEQIKKMVSVSSTATSRKAWSSKDSDALLELYAKKCPPGGEKSIVIYTTTLRGIRKTFEDCNVVRSVIESQDVQMFERDVSMHSGYKEELRRLMSSKEIRVPLVFVKGRLIGGANEMVRLDEEGKLGILFDGIPRAAAGCGGCGGIRFVMCMECNGSCKVLGEDGKKSLKCSECNENGLIQCPICC